MTPPSCRNYHARRWVSPSIRRMCLCSPMVQLSSCERWDPYISSFSPNNSLIPGLQVKVVLCCKIWTTMTPPSCQNYHARRWVSPSIRRMRLCSPMVQLSSCERWDPYIPSFSPNNSLIPGLQINVVLCCKIWTTMTPPSCRNYHARRWVSPSIRRMCLCSPMVQLSSCERWDPYISSFSPNNSLIPGLQINVVLCCKIWTTMTPPSCQNYHARRWVSPSIRRMCLCSPMVQLSSCERWDPYIPSFSPNNSLIARLYPIHHMNEGNRFDLRSFFIV